MIAFTALFALPVMWLWNYVCPDVFHLPQIDFWHAWALLSVAHIVGESTSLLVKSGNTKAG
jgi:hypothetical protein